jgi:hypothetical protein
MYIVAFANRSLHTWVHAWVHTYMCTHMSTHISMYMCTYYGHCQQKSCSETDCSLSGARSKHVLSNIHTIRMVNLANLARLVQVKKVFGRDGVMLNRSQVLNGLFSNPEISLPRKQCWVSSCLEDTYKSWQPCRANMSYSISKLVKALFFCRKVKCIFEYF